MWKELRFDLRQLTSKRFSKTIFFAALLNPSTITIVLDEFRRAFFTLSVLTFFVVESLRFLKRKSTLLPTLLGEGNQPLFCSLAFVVQAKKKRAFRKLIITTTTLTGFAGGRVEGFSRGVDHSFRVRYDCAVLSQGNF